MKKMKLFIGMAVFAALVSCSDDDNTPNNSAAISQIVNTVNQGTWRITSYTDDTVDETAHFAGFNFTFGSNGILTATKQDVTYTGIWSVTNSNSNDDDSPGNDIDFNIGFTSPADFAELTDDWDIIERTENKIRLIDVSGGNGGTDYVTFEKN